MNEAPPRPPNEPLEPDLRSFRSLVPIVFQSNFTDNAYRMVVWLFVSAVAVADDKLPDTYRSLTALFFTAPYLIFSLLSGQMADRFSKRTMVAGAKIAEVLVVLGGAMLMAMGGGMWASLVILLLLGTRLCFFGPATYGMIPELLPEKKLSWANGWIEGATYMGAIIGTSLGGILFDMFKHRVDVPLLILGIAGAVALVFVLGITALPAAEPSREISILPLRGVAANIREIRQKPGLFWAVIGIIVWWGAAVLALQTAMKMAEDALHLSGFGTSRLFIYVGLGVALGSYTAGRLSYDKIELGLVPLGGFFMGGCFITTTFLPETEFWKSLGVGLGGFFSGWFIVPLKAFVQHRASPESRGGILGTLNFFQYAAILVAGAPIYFILTVVLRLNSDQTFFVLGCFAILMGCVAIQRIPTAGLRLILFVFAHTIYRLRVQGRERVPDKGGALLVCNHMSYADGLLIIASMDRPVRPIMFEDIYEHPLVKPFAVLSRAIPVSTRMGPRDMIKALRTASEAIKQGDLVCIFAEGQITRTGNLLPFRAGLERVMKGVDAPIIPMHLDRMWGSIFSFGHTKRWLVRMPRRIPWPVTVSFGEPMPSDSSSIEVRKAVQLLASEAWEHRRGDARLLHHEVFRMARRRPLETCMYDPLTPKGVRRLMFATGVVVIARLLRRTWKNQKYVGICLPPSIGGAMVNHAALLLGKVPVNLNYTVSEAVMKDIVAQCEIDSIVTSRQFLEKAGMKLPGRLVHMEEVRNRVTGRIKFVSLLQALFAPLTYLEQSLGATQARNIDDTATIIFSSGSTGKPKGVMLSHWNLYSNIEAVGQVFSFTRRDVILGVLPFFHSFGTMATLFLPHSLGIKVAFYPNPLDAAAIGQIVHEYKVTFVVATPTFLQNFMRRIDPSLFGSVEIVITGAEKLRESIAVAFEQKFGVRPLEGYGATETAPVIAVGTPDFRAPGFYQRGSKPAKIGLPLPNVTLKVVNPETYAELPLGEEGLLLVRGPNVMQGYLDMPEKTAEVVRDGWYVTGDIAKLDEDGFIEITDRLARFSKVGGEMVPHVRVEEALHQALDLHHSVFAVTGIPDEKRGERLIVFYTVSKEDARKAQETISRNGDMPNLWIPKFQDFHPIDEIPLLGTGKTDLRALKELALEKSRK